MTVLQRIIDTIAPPAPPKPRLDFRNAVDASKFKAALTQVEKTAWLTEKGIAIKPKELPKFQVALAERGLMNDPMTRWAIGHLDKSAEHYLEFTHDKG